MSIDLKSLARYGAETRLAAIRQETRMIFGLFPELRLQAGARRQHDASAASVAHDTTESRAEPARSSRRSRMSAKARKAASIRMKKYWAGHRKSTAQ